MIRNYFKTAIRNFQRNIGYTMLNISGLAIGMAACLVILLYVENEFSYDNFHENGAQIHRVEFDAYQNGSLQFKCATAFPAVGPNMKADFPEVEDYCRLFLRYGGGVVRYGERSFKEENLFQADQSFFDLFSYELIRGDRNTVLKEPNTAVIAEGVVKKYFGEEDPVGKRIKFGNDEDYEITGIIKSPENSHLKFNFLLSYPTLVNLWGEQFDNAWGWYDFYTYIKVVPGSSISGLQEKFPEFINKYSEREDAHERTKFVLQPLEEIHLHSDLIQEARVNGNAYTVYFLTTIAFFILIIAWVNYINLSTAKAMERAKEVGIRKSVGAFKNQLVKQFIFESLLLNVLAIILASVIMQLSMPFFNNLANKQLTTGAIENFSFWGLLIIVFIVGAFLSGLYPAFVLSSYKPVEVIKGQLGKVGGGLNLRKFLVIAQFAASGILIIGTIVVYQQLSFMRNQDLGFKINETLVINAPSVIPNDTIYRENLFTFKKELLKHTHIQNVAASTEIPGNLIYWTNGARKLGKEASQSSILYRVGIDYDYINGYDHEVLAGRAYSEEFTGDTDSTSVILNEAAIEMLDLGSPESAIQEKIVTGGDTLTVVGVIKNYHQEGLKKDYTPIAFILLPNARSYFSIKLNTTDLGQSIATIQEQYGKFFPENPFNYFFLDTFFDTQYQSEVRFGKIFTVFSGLAIFVASLGLFGLSFFTAGQRTKEIGIRKSLGSSVSNIFMLLSIDFIKLVFWGNVIAWPLAWYIMGEWLSGFAFQINLGLSVFLVATIVTLFIALLTVSYQSIKAAMSNPVEALKYE
ncbi:ABC transporter permease [Fulvivirgaceae bacterium BMA10]|uniref:ABC transporter permease n=1 Tax=Splendidivirga corallicola TaxID=3051826 RepID=A0ABT8KHH4_9BACT|nr:ABC transporter permease [Fulvivirgaceae bacterium BMA10]